MAPRELTEEERNALEQLTKYDDLRSAEWARKLLEADNGGDKALSGAKT